MVEMRVNKGDMKVSEKGQLRELGKAPKRTTSTDVHGEVIRGIIA